MQTDWESCATHWVHLKVDELTPCEGDDHLPQVDGALGDVFLARCSPLVHTLVCSDVTDAIWVDLQHYNHCTFSRHPATAKYSIIQQTLSAEISKLLTLMQWLISACYRHCGAFCRNLFKRFLRQRHPNTSHSSMHSMFDQQTWWHLAHTCNISRWIFEDTNHTLHDLNQNRIFTIIQMYLFYTGMRWNGSRKPIAVKWPAQGRRLPVVNRKWWAWCPRTLSPSLPPQSLRWTEPGWRWRRTRWCKHRTHLHTHKQVSLNGKLHYLSQM